jgi:hypothetical protein
LAQRALISACIRVSDCQVRTINAGRFSNQRTSERLPSAAARSSLLPEPETDGSDWSIAQESRIDSESSTRRSRTRAAERSYSLNLAYGFGILLKLPDHRCHGSVGACAPFKMLQTKLGSSAATASSVLCEQNGQAGSATLPEVVNSLGFANEIGVSH